MEKKKWLAVYTKPRWEKKVNLLLQEKGIESYCPLNRIRRRWSDRMKVVEEPLFKSYVFVRIGENSLTSVRMTNGVVNFVYWLGKPAVVKEKEIETIRKFLNDYTQVEVHPVDIQVNSKIQIQRGAFMDKEAVVKKIMKKKVQVIIESIGYKLTAYIDRSNITVTETKSNHHLTNKKI